VCPHDNFQRTKRRTIILGYLVVRCNVKKISPKFEGQVQRSRSPGAKKNEQLLSRPHWQCMGSSNIRYGRHYDVTAIM